VIDFDLTGGLINQLCDEFLHFVQVVRRDEVNGLSVHWFKSLEIHAHVMASFRHGEFVDLRQVLPKLDLVCTCEFSMLLALVEEFNLRNRANIVSRGCVSCIITVYSTEDNVFVFVAARCRLKCWLEANTWPTRKRKEVNHHCLAIFDNLREVCIVLDLDHLAGYGRIVGVSSLKVLSLILVSCILLCVHILELF